MNDEQKSRLEKLAAHLEAGNLDADVFRFAHYRQVRLIGGACLTTGCAIGECPALFPEDWTWTPFSGLDGVWHTSPRLRSHASVWRLEAHGVTRISAQEFFGLTYDEYSALFLPMSQDELLDFKGEQVLPMLPREATPAKVAENIRTFVREYNNIKKDTEKVNL